MRFFLPEEREPKSILLYEILSPRRTRTEVHSPLWESFSPKNEDRSPFSPMGIYLPEERGPKSILLYENLSP